MIHTPRFPRLATFAGACLSLAAIAGAQVPTPASATPAPATPAATAPAKPAAPINADSAAVAAMRWRNIGPANFGGRVSDVVGIPSPSKTFYVASAAGGIWKTTNAGITFRPIFDNQRVVAMGMLAIAPSDTQQVWAGTGEPNSRNTIEPGNGIYKSSDGGTSWKLMGLEKTQHIGRIVVHPTNPNIVYVAALGAAWKANPERGLYKTTDGGATWTLSKFIDDSTGFVDVAMDPSNPQVLYASAYQRLRGPYFLKSGGKGSGLWKTTDGGTTWTQITGGGFPETMKGRIGLAIARSNSNIVYALVEADTLANAKPVKGTKAQATKSGLYRSDDAGKTWKFMNDQDTRPFYYSQVRVDPKNPDRVYWSSTPVLFSDDGGKTARTATQGIHVDHHAMWIDPNDAEHIIVGDDGGVSQSWDRGGNYQFINTLPIGQFYAVSFDYAVPYNICGGAQDNGTWCGPSRRKNGGVPNSYWFTYSGGDGFWTAQDPMDPKVIYGESQGGFMSRWNIGTGDIQFLQTPGYRQRYRQWEDSIVVARGDTTVAQSKELKARLSDLRNKQKADSLAFSLRFNWETPYFLSPHNSSVFYAAGNRVLKSTKRGDDLYPISPDLSKQLTQKIDISTKTTGGITLDATGAETYGTVVALAESYVKPGILYAGTDDGNVWYTMNDGAQWTQVPQSKFGGLPNEVYVSRVEPSHFDTLTWYVSFDNHRNNDFAPYVYATSDGGRTFNSIAATLPTGGPDYVRVIREDPFNRDLLFAGTSVGAYASLDRGRHWQKFMTGMPTVPVFDLKVHPRDHDLIAATHGRNFFIVNVAALENVAGKALAGPTLFAPTKAYTYGEAPTLGISANGSGQQAYTAPGAPYGAEIYYYLPQGTPTKDVKVRVYDAFGDTLATLAGGISTGIQRVIWPFRATKPRRDLPPLTPSEFRDSVQYYTLTARALDSVAKAGWDTAFVRKSREMLISPVVVNVNINCGGQVVASPDAKPSRPAEGGVVRSGNGCTIDVGGSTLDCDKWMDLQRMINPTASIQPGSCVSSIGFSRSTNNNFEATPGDYLVTLTVGDKVYRQTLRVEKAGIGEVRLP